MEYPKSLMFVLAMLAIGFCFDIFAFIEVTDSTARVLILLFFAGRIAAMWGIVTRKMIGWWFAFGYLLVLVALSIPNFHLSSILTVLCLLFVVTARGEFE